MSYLEKYLVPVLKFQKQGLLALAVFLLLIPIIVNLLLGKPLLMGQESYYHLQQAETVDLKHLHYFPLRLISSIVPPDALVMIPLLLAIASLLLMFKISASLALDLELVFYFMLFWILSPAFIHNYGILSASSYFLFLLLLAMRLFLAKNTVLAYLSAIPLLAASFFNVFYTLMGITLFWFYADFLKKEFKKSRLAAIVIICLALVSASINFFWLGQSIFPPEFNDLNIITGLVSAFGAAGGVSLFVVLLALIGLVIARKRNKLVRPFIPYFLLTALLAGYLLNRELLFLFSLIIAFFAAVAFIFLIQQRWKLPLIKAFTIFILLLGILFSTISYLHRVNDNSPLAANEETLRWIGLNTPQKAIILSSPEQANYVTYFSQRRSFPSLYQDKDYAQGQYLAIIGSLQLDELLHLLDIHQVSILYLTPELKRSLPTDHGLLSLLNTENFKLVRSQQGFEVWFYQKNSTTTLV